MNQKARFFIIFVMQGIIALVMVIASQSGNSQLLDFTAGAAVMVFVLMLIIWLFSVIDVNISK